jgi:hypothetical protein
MFVIIPHLIIWYLYPDSMEKVPPFWLSLLTAIGHMIYFVSCLEKNTKNKISEF